MWRPRTVSLVVFLLAMVLTIRPTPGLYLRENDEDSVDEEGLTSEQQAAADVVEEGTETQKKMNISALKTYDSLVEARAQKIQMTLEGVLTDEQIAELIQYYKNQSPDQDNIRDTADTAKSMYTRRAPMTKRVVLYNQTSTGFRFWENGIVPYGIESAETEKSKALITAGLDYLSSMTCVKFVLETSNTRRDYNITHNTTLWFVKDPGCWSVVGRMALGRQEISACGGQETIHEALHAVGAAHEQSRSDYAGHIQINWGNIQKSGDAAYQFAKEDTINNVPYDLSSIMQYKLYSFSGNDKPTMTVYDTDLAFSAGMRSSKLSFYDIQGLTKAYHCQERLCSDTTLDCKNQGFIGYVNDQCVCVCPDGLIGPNCEEINSSEGCGGIIDLIDTATVSLPVDPETGNYYNNQECRWLIKNTNLKPIKLTMSAFDVRVYDVNDIEPCEDYLEIRHNTIVTPGARYCGHRFVRSLISKDDSMMLVFKSDEFDGAKGFTAVFTAIDDTDYNYDVSLNGVTYNGKVNYTLKYETCLDWDAVVHCSYNPFKDFLSSMVLGGNNYCRNPTMAERPWCYFNQNCDVNYCDVSGIGDCYDKDADCATNMTSDTYCDSVHGFENCHKSCQYCGSGTEKKADGCGPAPEAQYADAVDPAVSYTEGQAVTYQCKNVPDRQEKRVCMNDGTWSQPSKLCQDCPLGWVQDKTGSCFKITSEWTSFDAARTICTNTGGDMAMPKDPEVNDESKSIMLTLGVGWQRGFYIGAVDDDNDGEFQWLDGSTVDLTNAVVAFDPNSQPPWAQYGLSSCLFARQKSKTTYEWDRTYCQDIWGYICQSSYSITLCADTRADCGQLMSRTPDMCTKYPRFAEALCRRSCGLCPTDSQDIDY